MLKKKLKKAFSNGSNPNKHSVQKDHMSEMDPLKWELPTISKDYIYENSKWEFLYGRGIHYQCF